MPPALTDYEYVFGDAGIVLNTDFGGVLPFIDVTDITGLDSAPQRLNSTEREGIDGTYVDNTYTSMRTVVITGTVYSTNTDESLVLALKAAYSNPTVQRFYFQHPSQNLKFVNAAGGGAKYDIDVNRRLGITDIQLTLLCGDPYIYDWPGNTFTSSFAPPSGAGLGFGFNSFLYNFLGSTASGASGGQNANFGSGIGTWAQNGNATLAAVGSPLFGSNTGAMSITSVASGNMGAAACTFASILTNGMDCAPGDNVQGSIQMEAATAARTCQAGFAFFDHTGTIIGSILYGTGTSDVTGSYTQINTGNITAPAGAVKCTLVALVQSTAAASEVHYVGAAGFTVQGVGFLGPGSALGLSFNGTVNAAQTTLENLGSHTAYPIITLVGPLVNPVIQDLTTGITMKLNMTLNTGDTVVINCNAKSIILNGYASRRSTYSGIFWFSIPPNTINTYFLSADSGTGSITALAYNTYY